MQNENENTTLETGKPCQFQKSPDTILIAKRLCALQPDEVVTYAELGALVPDRNLTGNDRHILDSARGDALREKIVTECVTGQGLRRLTDEQIAKLPAHVVKSIHRKAKKGMKKAVCADPEKMNDSHKKDHLVGLSALGAMLLCSKQKTINAIESAVIKTQKRLPSTSVFALFEKKV